MFNWYYFFFKSLIQNSGEAIQARNYNYGKLLNTNSISLISIKLFGLCVLSVLKLRHREYNWVFQNFTVNKKKTLNFKMNKICAFCKWRQFWDVFRESLLCQIDVNTDNAKFPKGREVYIKCKTPQGSQRWSVTDRLPTLDRPRYDCQEASKLSVEALAEADKCTSIWLRPSQVSA